MVQLYANNKTGVANSPTVTVIRPTANLNIQCDNIVNPPSGEFIFTTYRTMSDGDGGQIVDPSSIREMTGTSSGNIITISAFAPGNTDIGNQVGDRVVFRPGAHWANTVAERLDETGNWAVNQDKLAATVADMTSPDNWILPNTGIISQVSGLIGAFSDIQYYISGKKYSKTGIANKTYTATKDTYVSINAAGVVTYTEVTVGAAAPAVPANSVVAAIVTTSGSAITSVVIKSHGAITKSNVDFASLWPWEVLGRVVATATATSLMVSNLPARKYLKVFIFHIATGGTAFAQIRFNNDTTNTISRRYSVDLGASTTGGPESSLIVSNGIASGTHSLTEIEILNVANREKIAKYITTESDVAGVANIPKTRRGVGKWANTSAQINRIDLVNDAGAGNFAAGTEIIVLGHD